MLWRYTNWPRKFVLNTTINTENMTKTIHYRFASFCFLLLAAFTLVSCAEKTVKDSAPRKASVDVDSVPNAVPKKEPKSKYGNPESYEVFGKRYYVLNDNKGFVQKGIASWYGKKFHGRRTSSGETYDMYAMTAAHKELPLPTYVEVTNLKNNKKIIVKVNDRGPFHDNRIIDLSYTAARKLDIVANGTGLVEVRAIDSVSRVAKSKPERQGAPVRVAYEDKKNQAFYIQVGAFSDETNANRLQQRLVSLSPELVKVYKGNVQGRGIFRVQIGPFYDVDSADALVVRLPDYGVTEHQIVVH